MMVKFKLGIPVIATVQKVGNKSREEGIAFASKADDMSFASEFVSTLVKTHLSLILLANLIRLILWI